MVVPAGAFNLVEAEKGEFLVTGVQSMDQNHKFAHNGCHAYIGEPSQLSVIAR
ncbi:hypothetical protein GCM10023183_01970 [Nibribacter koreensis]|uniref:Uncharacterized protein n=1 Tax=Nibribacter koreensis TaxID=1084519 RepID=A0ABP8F5X9_9BACT